MQNTEEGLTDCDPPWKQRYLDPSGLPPQQGAHRRVQIGFAITAWLCSDEIKKATAFLIKFHLSHPHRPSAWQDLGLDCYFFKSKIFIEAKVVQYPPTLAKKKKRKKPTHTEISRALDTRQLLTLEYVFNKEKVNRSLLVFRQTACWFIAYWIPGIISHITIVFYMLSGLSESERNRRSLWCIDTIPVQVIFEWHDRLNIFALYIIFSFVCCIWVLSNINHL